MMSILKILHLLLPPIFFKIWRKIFPRPLPSITPLQKLQGHAEKMIVIGNGPSFKESLAKYGFVIKRYDRIAVNYFASTAAYLDIQPNYYAFADPMWFGGKQEFKDAVIDLLETMVKVTTWEMNVIMPDYAKGKEITNILSRNSNLKLHYYYSGESIDIKKSMFDALDKNLVGPPAQTVLNTAVWLSIYWGYRETYLVGADTSWHAELKMDQETNELYTIDTHFYDNRAVYGNLYDEKQNRRPIGTKLHEELFAEATALKEYCELREYAEWKGVKVYNASEYSWIDAFERKKLK